MITIVNIMNIAQKYRKELEEEFRPMNEFGRLESLTYFALICNFSAQYRYDAHNMRQINQDLFAYLIDEYKMNLDETDVDKIGMFIETRFANHQEDVVMILDTDAKFSPINSYYFFYDQPFAKDRPNKEEYHVDEAELARFKEILVAKSKACLQETDDVPDDNGEDDRQRAARHMGLHK